MADYAGLKAELASSAYEGMTDDQIASALIAETVIEYRDVPVVFVESYLRQRLLMSAIAAFSATPPDGSSAQAVGAASELSGLISSPRLTSFLTSDTATRSAVTSLLGALGPSGAGILTDQNIADLLAPVSSQTSRAKQLGFDPAVHDMVQEIAAARLIVE